MRHDPVPSLQNQQLFLPTNVFTFALWHALYVVLQIIICDANTASGHVCVHTLKAFVATTAHVCRL